MNTNKQSLYRTYRPKDFNSVAGHNNIKEILEKQIKDNRINHALLFSGQRGTGKTSVARIFAKTINCLNLTNSTACEQCNNCKLANQNQLIDIIEIDAASNNGVDEIREIKNSVSTLPLNSKYKVYIIDEVHMLTKQAFNALLKTLEEPPVYAIFILATTEFNKIPQTILSRCQIFNFTKIDKNSLKNRLQYIANQENYQIEKEVLDEIFYLSEGSLRDAINILEQLMLATDDLITIKTLKSIFLIATKQEQLQVIHQSLNNNTSFIISYFQKANDQGMNWDVFALGLIEILKEIIEYKLTYNTEFLSILEKNEVEQFNNINVNNLFILTDNLAEAYFKTKAANISFNYLLLSLLKTINSNNNNLQETSKTINTKQVEQNQEILKANDITLEILGEPIIDEPIIDEPVIQQPIIDDLLLAKDLSDQALIKNTIENDKSLDSANLDDQINEFDFYNQKEQQIDEISKTLSELKIKFNIHISQAINSKVKMLFNEDLISILIETKNYKNQIHNIEQLLEDLFLQNDDQLVNAQIASELFMLLDSKIISLTNDVIVLKTQTKAQANLINDSMLDNHVLQQIYNWFKKPYLIFAIDKMKWDEIKTIFIDLKNKNKLSEYSEINLKQLKEKYLTINDEIDQDLINKAKDLFNDDFMIGD
ncbi:DNA polymerase III subunit gamma/tau [Mycoplasma mycoides]|uniref:DNA polymerase III subunit gamma/tau n=1 Tax=Mycoplasma mycoides TaxID=2102 RepID=UPI00273458F6|nr:DNA polymerase III subunit gamma/tau [Mycoplasma mycoides]MDP4040676.1 DNA polymerase III subunit gamma/tau [Mycoplasma mycoides]MDP4041499.1 DNA polymerase III subunit gamma/tau [Mycoplasma mycoides]MDP4042437.1 DNA polymerase III subunit gamma/tau [Mycoplasma mycoides]MDP4043853.1 DNA polymerase III subunit gamma/tau [Mycoplasma mycoides]MDP4044784.1 DNA polymerase III subunit gamma/tau [Mycoplasma mycoides]